MREIIGNYNNHILELVHLHYYTLERDNRELQPVRHVQAYWKDYTLERDNRELQQDLLQADYRGDYTLERDNRELQRT